MNIAIIFIAVLICILLADTVTGLLMTMLYTNAPMQQSTPLDQTYLFYIIAAIFIAIFITLLQKMTKKATR